MRNFFVLFLILACLMVNSCSQKNETALNNKYLNLGFEDFTPNGTPKFWMAGGQGYKGVVDKEVVFEGEASLRLEKTGTVQGFGVATSMFPLDEARGKRVRFSGYIKTEEVADGYAGLWWRVDGPGRKMLAFDNMAGRGVTGTTDWQEYVIELDVAVEVININFGAILPGSGKAWFDELRIELDGEPYLQTRPEPAVPKRADLSWIRNQAVPIATVDPAQAHDDLSPLKDMIGDRRIVALGEGTHGTSEFFRMKHRIVRFLVEEMGFTVFAIEANMPEARAVNRYVLNGEGDAREALAGLYFWTWNTQEVLDMIEWMRTYNSSGAGRVEFLGFDMQFPEVAMENVTEFARKADPKYLPELEELYAQVRDIWKASRIQRDRSQIDFNTWHAAALAVYEHLKENEPAYAEDEGTMEAAWVVQDANVVVQAAEAGMRGKRGRDESMAENLAWILDHHPAGTRIVTWAHNGHVGKGSRFYASMGHFLDKRYGDEHLVFGFAFHEGEYTAIGDKGLNVYSTTASEPGSVEWFLKESGMSNFFLDLRKASSHEKGSGWLLKEMDFRSIGAMAIEYAFAARKVREDFDILVYFDKTTPSNCFGLTGR